VTIQKAKKSETTISVPKIVGVVWTSELFARRLVNFVSDFISIDMNFRTVPLKGDLSEWIDRLAAGRFLQGIIQWENLQCLGSCLEVVKKLCCPTGVRELIAIVESSCSRELLNQLVQEAHEKRDFRYLNSCIGQIADKAGLREFSAIECCELLRATQVAMRVLVWYRCSPLELIDRARRGDQEAVLDLVRIDRLFLVDSCTQDVIRRAVLENDNSFTSRLGRIEQPKFGRRHACEWYFYTLAIFGLQPPLDRLRLVIDPEDKAFPKLYDFSKCFERRRKEIEAY
jgi:hypothetical protein